MNDNTEMQRDDSPSETIDESTGEIIERAAGMSNLEKIVSHPRHVASLIGAPRPIDISAVNIITALSSSWKESGYFGIRYPDQAIVLMAKAYELGFGLTTAFDYFDVITLSTREGNVTRIYLKPKAALALIFRSGLLAKGKMIIDDRKRACYVYMERSDNGYGFGLEFSMEDAAQAQLIKPNGAWEKWPKNMLRWRAIGIVSDLVFPDVKAGMRTSDEMPEIIDYEDIR